MKKTNAARILDGEKIVYEIKAYTVDPNDLSAPNVAAKVGIPVERVFKTLVARGDGLRSYGISILSKLRKKRGAI